MNEIGSTSCKPAAHIGLWNVVTAHFDTLGDAADGEVGRWQPEVVEFDLKNEGFGLLEQLGVGRSAEGAFETEGEADFKQSWISWSRSLPALTASF